MTAQVARTPVIARERPYRAVDGLDDRVLVMFGRCHATLPRKRRESPIWPRRASTGARTLRDADWMSGGARSCELERNDVIAAAAAEVTT